MGWEWGCGGRALLKILHLFQEKRKNFGSEFSYETLALPFVRYIQWRQTKRNVSIYRRYQSPLNCRSKNVRTPLFPEWITVTIVIFQAYNLCSCLKWRGFALSRTKGCLNSQNSLLLDNIWKDNWQRRFIRGRCSYVCRIKEGWKNVPNGELVGTTECRSFKRVKMY